MNTLVSRPGEGATAAPVGSGPSAFPPAAALGDDVLARRVRNGDDLAFEELYRRYHARLYRYCVSVLGNPQEAEEALQSAMFSAYRALRERERELHLRAWLYRIAHNQCLDLLRRRRDADELSGLEEEPGPRVDEQVAVREDLRQLRRDLAALVPQQRTALVLREMSGLSHAEIAATIEATPAVAKQLIHDARRSLAAFATGRDLPCAEVRRRLSDQDGRVMRGGAIRSHLRACPDCALYKQTLTPRPSPLRLLVPPLALGGVGGLGGGGLAAKAAVVGAVAVAGAAAIAPLGLGDRVAGHDPAPRAGIARHQPTDSPGRAAAEPSTPRRASTPARAVPQARGPRAARPATPAEPGAPSASRGTGAAPAAGSLVLAPAVATAPGAARVDASAGAGGASARVRARVPAGGLAASANAGTASAALRADAAAGAARASASTPVGSVTVPVTSPLELPPVALPAP
jgi:RNA polymerase sigma factor (sigma-70 family)